MIHIERTLKSAYHINLRQATEHVDLISSHKVVHTFACNAFKPYTAD